MKCSIMKILIFLFKKKQYYLKEKYLIIKFHAQQYLDDM
jgi:hypothetical protein